jgi:TonB family protein
MRRLIIHLLLALLTFALGMTADAFIKSLRELFDEEFEIETVSIPPEIPAEFRTRFESERPFESETSQIPCACHRGYRPMPAARSLTPLSGGVLNGRALCLPVPAYPSLAHAAHVSGKVAVQVTVDEGGCVIAARAISGHPLLQAAAVEAAYRACFSPASISGDPVKVNGLITYNFIL